MKTPHLPVLPNETIEIFKDAPQDGLFIDCTVGYGGHSEALLEAYPNWTHLGLDRDETAINFSGNRLAKFANRSKLELIDFGSAKLPKFSALLADIGVSSLQLDEKSRGFGFDSETLDMRMDSNSSFSAYDIVNGYSEDELGKIFLEYGEERMYKKYAGLIVKERKSKKIESAKELSELVSRGASRGRIHPATLIFQAIRIEVNDELGQLESLLANIPQNAGQNAVVAIISFHSLEDRIVKNAMKNWSKNCICDEHVMKCVCGNNHSKGQILTKKPLIASDNELK
ncbi:MAG: rRNA ((1402)-N(4))-methyltransferase RsmH, partial [Pseudomonadota bacterium]